MNLEIGDEVSFLDSTEKGTITNISNKNIIYVKTQSGFLVKASPKELVKYAPDIYTDISISHKKLNLDKKQNVSQKKSTSIIKNVIPEIDLHIETILENHIGMTNHEIVSYQLKYAEEKMFYFRKKGIKKVIFIHGKGEGVLRSEIYYLFSKYDAHIEDAPYEKFGYKGASIISLK